jgi:hypothetical protein
MLHLQGVSGINLIISRFFRFLFRGATERECGERNGENKKPKKTLTTSNDDTGFHQGFQISEMIAIKGLGKKKKKKKFQSVHIPIEMSRNKRQGIPYGRISIRVEREPGLSGMMQRNSFLAGEDMVVRRCCCRGRYL